MTIRTIFGSCLLTAALAAHSAFAQSWTHLSFPAGTSPVGRTMNGAAGVYDPASNRMMVFGGRDKNGKNLNDMWVLTNANGVGGASQWVELIPKNAAGSPPARSGHSTVYDAVNNRLIVFGGCGGNCVPALNDVWVLTNANGLGGTPVWTELSPHSSVGFNPLARTNSVAAFDPANGSMIIFGGQDGSANACSTLSDMWMLSFANGLGGTPEWTSPFGFSSPPVGRNGSASVYNASTGVLTVFGGMGLVNGTCQATNAVWQLSTGNLARIGVANVIPEGAAGSPSPRAFASAVYDATGARMLIFDGVDGSDYLNDVWSLANANGLGSPAWSMINPTGGPPEPRSGHVAVFDSASQRMTVFAGGDASGVLNDSWVLHAPGVSGLSCAATALVSGPNALGITEQVGDVLLECTGGTPTPKGEAIPDYTINLTLNTAITSRRLPEAAELSEALLIIDDAFPANPIPPYESPAPSAPPQILCAPLGSNCGEKGTGGTPSPYQTQPNVFAGKQTGVDSLEWNIPLDPPGANATRTIRLTNVLANVSQVSVAADRITVQATVKIHGTRSVPLANPQQVVAESTQGPLSTVLGGAPIPECKPHNGVLLGGKSAAAFDFSIQIQEDASLFFMYRNYGTFLYGIEFPAALVEQNVPGFGYDTETGFYSPSLFTAAPTLGLADSGMRLRLSFGPMQAGTHLFVPTTITLTGDYPPGSIPGQIQLVQTDSNGKSAPGYEPVASTATIGTTPVAEVGISGSTATAVYEVIYSLPGIQETATIPVAVAFTNKPVAGVVMSSTTLAPVSAVETAAQSAPIPRFVNIATLGTAYSITACTTP